MSGWFINSRFMGSNRSIQLVLASGSGFFLEGVRNILKDEDNIKIVAEALSGKEVIKCLADIKPDFLFLDNRALKLGINKILNLISKTDMKVILFGNQTENEDNSSKIIYLTKETDSSGLIDIIRNSNKAAWAKGAARADAKKVGLTKMETRVVKLIVSGFSNKEIAERLSMSEKTAKAHLSNIFKKLGLQSRYQLIVYAKKLKPNKQLSPFSLT